jgi:hypothetical protein
LPKQRRDPSTGYGPGPVNQAAKLIDAGFNEAVIACAAALRAQGIEVIE